MKCLASLLVVFLSVVVINGYPQRVTLVGIPRSDFFASPFEQDRRNREIEDGTATTSDSEETDIDGRGPPSIFEVSDNPYYYSPSVAEMMANMQAMIARLKLEMSEILKRIPDTSDEKGVASGSEYPNIFSIGSGLDFSNAQNKSTSKTQVIDGQTYVVNETVVRSGDDDHGSVFRIKTIQLKPAHTTTGTETELEVTDSTQSGGVDEPQTSTKINPSKNEDNNEIPNEGKIRFTEWDSLENIENVPSDHLNEVETSNEVELLEPTDSFKPVQYDLSHDTLVNDYVSDQHVAQGLVLIDPDAEFIDIDKTKSNHNDYYRYESQPLYQSPNKFEKLVQ